MIVNILSGAFLLLFAAVYWLGADAIPKSPLSGSVGADGLPKLLAVALVILSCAMMLQSYLLHRSTRSRSPKIAIADDSGDIIQRNHLRAFGILAIGLGFVAIFEYAGYALSVGALLIAVAMFYGRRLTAGLLAYGIIAAAIFYFIFVWLLGVIMPSGSIPGLSTWL